MPINVDFIRNQWLPALRSDAYDQTSEVLHFTDDDGHDSYCCLGVACVLLQDELELTADRQDREHGDVTAYDDEVGTLPGAAAHHIGIVSDGCFKIYSQEGYELLLNAGVRNVANKHSVNDYSCSDTLTGLNDRGNNFPTIARAIELILDNPDHLEFHPRRS